MFRSAAKVIAPEDLDEGGRENGAHTVRGILVTKRNSRIGISKLKNMLRRNSPATDLMNECAAKAQRLDTLVNIKRNSINSQARALGSAPRMPIQYRENSTVQTMKAGTRLRFCSYPKLDIPSESPPSITSAWPVHQLARRQ